MTNILCFGDSNTFGTNPAGGRWPRNQRWPGILQQRLGSGYYLIEEGLGGRTALAQDTLEPDRNGAAQLPVALHSHRPLDLVILMLGTNDLKERFHLLPGDIAGAVEKLGCVVEHYDYGPWYPVPQVLLVSPIVIGEGVEDSVFPGFSPDSPALSRQLAPLYRQLAAAHGWLFSDAATVAEPSPADRLHMEADSHRALALALEQVIRNAFPPPD